LAGIDPLLRDLPDCRRPDDWQVFGPLINLSRRKHVPIGQISGDLPVRTCQ